MIISQTSVDLSSHKHIAFSPVKDIFALITQDDKINFYTSNFEFVTLPIKYDKIPTAIQFCSHFLVIGFQDGSILLFSNGNLTKLPSPHQHPILHIYFHLYHPFFVVSSSDGVISFWNETSFLFEGKIDNAIFSVLIIPREDPAALIFDVKSRIHLFCSLDPKLSELGAAPSPIISVFVLRKLQKIFVVTDENIISQYSLAGTVLSLQSSLKVLTGRFEVFPNLTKDVICYSVGNIVTFWNPQSGESSNLKLQSNFIVSSINFSHNTGVLYLTTEDGKILLNQATMNGVLRNNGWESILIVDSKMPLMNVYWSAYCPICLAQSSKTKSSLISYVSQFAIITDDFRFLQTDINTLSSETKKTVSFSNQILSLTYFQDYVLLLQKTMDLFTLLGV